MFDNEKGLEMSFEIPQGYKNFKLSYTTTGHGGWENGDEFLQKRNTIFIDNKEDLFLGFHKADEIAN
jgi:hypothetical protein